MSQRNDQLASVLRRALQNILQRGLNDPRVRGLISVTSVELAPDLSEAVVNISVIPEEHAELSMRGLRSAAKHLRSEVARDVSLRRIPRLNLRLDRSLKKEAAVHAAINDAVARDQERADVRQHDSEETTT